MQILGLYMSQLNTAILMKNFLFEKSFSDQLHATTLAQHLSSFCQCKHTTKAPLLQRNESEQLQDYCI